MRSCWKHFNYKCFFVLFFVFLTGVIFVVKNYSKINVFIEIVNLYIYMYKKKVDKVFPALIGIIFKEKMISSMQQTCPTGEEPQEAVFACHDGLTCCRPHWPQPSAAPSPNKGDCQINTESKANHSNTGASSNGTLCSFKNEHPNGGAKKNKNFKWYDVWKKKQEYLPNDVLQNDNFKLLS